MLGATINSSLINVTNDTITTSTVCVDNPSYPEREVAPSAVGWHTLQLSLSVRVVRFKPKKSYLTAVLLFDQERPVESYCKPSSRERNKA